MTALRPKMLESGGKQGRSASEAVHRASLGIQLNGGR
jgi:hypothetical protein